MTIDTLGVYLIIALSGAAFGWAWMSMRLWRRETEDTVDLAVEAIDVLVAAAGTVPSETLGEAASEVTNVLRCDARRRYGSARALRKMRGVLRNRGGLDT